MTGCGLLLHCITTKRDFWTASFRCTPSSGFVNQLIVLQAPGKCWQHAFCPFRFRFRMQIARHQKAASLCISERPLGTWHSWGCRVEDAGKQQTYTHTNTDNKKGFPADKLNPAAAVTRDFLHVLYNGVVVGPYCSTVSDDHITCSELTLPKLNWMYSMLNVLLLQSSVLTLIKPLKNFHALKWLGCNSASLPSLSMCGSMNMHSPPPPLTCSLIIPAHLWPCRITW